MHSNQNPITYSTNIELVRAQGAEVVPSVIVRLELEERLMMRVVGVVTAQGRAGRRGGLRGWC